MKNYLLKFLSLFAIGGAVTSMPDSAMAASLYDLTAKDIDGQTLPLSNFRGKVLLIVNTASKCGFTPQYEDLEKLYDKYKERGFSVLGFPSNDFMGQEPGSEQEIKSFCKLKYNVSFPMFSKGAVGGAAKQAVFKLLTEQSAPDLRGEVRWNFEKFLLDRQGRLVGRWRSTTSPMHAQITEKIEELLMDGSN